MPEIALFEAKNSTFDFTNSPFHVQTTLSEWKVDTTPRRAGVSSFGMDGTIAHAVLEAAPRRELSGESRPWKPLRDLPGVIEVKLIEREHMQNTSQLHISDFLCDSPVPVMGMSLHLVMVPGFKIASLTQIIWPPWVVEEAAYG